MLRYDGKVVLVTGSGNGLGKEYALAFGDRGATVIVNDLGGSSSGEGSSNRPADLVVKEIVDKGGKAVANYDSVEKGEKIIKFIIDKFGRIDVIIHNAGILRDKSLAKMKEIDWDLVQRIHLRSVFVLTKASWPYMLKQKYGRHIMITSCAGIYGNFGQSNYSAAKLGVFAFSQCAALEGKKYNIRVNCVAPIAGSRLTRFVMPDDVADALKAKFVAPLLLWLSHEECTESGSLFECGAGWMGKLRWERTDGAVIRKQTEDFTVDDVKSNWKQICDFSKSHHPNNFHDANFIYFNLVERYDKFKDLKFIEDFITYQPKNVILYALAVGMKVTDNKALQYLYESHKNFACLPTFSSVLTLGETLISSIPSFPNGQLPDFTRQLHGEQYTQVFKVLPTEGKFKFRSQLMDFVDKGKLAQIIMHVEILSEKEELMALNQYVLVFQGQGGFGGPKSSAHLILVKSPPSRKPDASVQEKTTTEQAALYRLLGDLNPLHIDPDYATLSGFKSPLLHGLCTYGIACKHVMNTFCRGEASMIKAVKTRFSREVIPGQTILTNMWKEDDRVFFESQLSKNVILFFECPSCHEVLETGHKCLTGGYVDLQTNARSKL